MAPNFSPATRASELVPYYASTIAGKTILITGISSGSLGESFVKQVAVANPATFILAGRSPTKFQSIVDHLAKTHPSITVKSLDLDLSSFANVREAAEKVNSWSDVPHIDVLVNNAGVMAVPYSLTKDGFENHFQTNHLGHFLFTNLIMEKILASNAPRIINVSSMGHRQGSIRWADYNFSGGKLYDRMAAYGQSKTANALTALALAEKLGNRGLLSFSVCPGSVGTNLASHEADNIAGLLAEYQTADARVGTKWMFSQDILFKDVDQGAATHVFAAFDPEITKNNGAFLNHCRLADPYAEEVFPWATDKVWADMLWTLSEKLVGQEFKHFTADRR
ncbi:short-chain dehydrogenase [Colletotrichum truncatum]|uniref:Short-chain dehydrogenase n=1 Tax=Colletotrichum truncatum TaxID=5467 RepID=A0ACC3YY48_COLTU|nr:short-chain dehydrogenase [Colletotrichum truncatum]KAF6790798.1 short-chain dehydrogenase [Colletotrichum truncatum]